MCAREGVWRLVVHAGTDPHTGKRVDVHETVRAPNNRAGAKAADARLAEIIAQVEAGKRRPPVPNADLRFADVATRWQHAHRPRQAPRSGDWVGWSPKTAKTTRDNFERYILPTLGGRDVTRVRGVDLDDLYEELERRGLSPAVVARCHSQIRAMFNWAIRKKLAEVNPAFAADPPKTKRSSLRVHDMSEVRRVQELATPSFAVYIQLAATVGARRGTMVALRWGDVDLDARTVTFERAFAESMEGLVEKGTKADRPYTAAIGRSTAEVLAEHRRGQAEAALAIGVGLGPESYVFSDDGGVSAWNLSWPTHGWKRYSTKAGLHGVRLHDLRHTAASQMLMAGVPLSVVAERLGCTEANILRTYCHFIPGSDRGAADLMDRLLDGDAAS